MSKRGPERGPWLRSTYECVLAVVLAGATACNSSNGGGANGRTPDEQPKKLNSPPHLTRLFVQDMKTKAVLQTVYLKLNPATSASATAAVQ